MHLASVAITKATRKTSFELSALGIPSISISHGLNPIDDARIAHLRTNIALRAREVTPEVLSGYICAALAQPERGARSMESPAAGRRAVLDRLCHHVSRIS